VVYIAVSLEFSCFFLNLISSKIDLVSRDTARFSNSCISSQGGVGERKYPPRIGETVLISEAYGTNGKKLSKRLKCIWYLNVDKMKDVVVDVDRLEILGTGNL
jgi:hypothetical protein